MVCSPSLCKARKSSLDRTDYTCGLRKVHEWQNAVVAVRGYGVKATRHERLILKFQATNICRVQYQSRRRLATAMPFRHKLEFGRVEIPLEKFESQKCSCRYPRSNT